MGAEYIDVAEWDLGVLHRFPPSVAEAFLAELSANAEDTTDRSAVAIRFLVIPLHLRLRLSGLIENLTKEGGDHLEDVRTFQNLVNDLIEFLRFKKVNLAESCRGELLSTSNHESEPAATVLAIGDRGPAYLVNVAPHSVKLEITSPLISHENAKPLELNVPPGFGVMVLDPSTVSLISHVPSREPITWLALLAGE